MNRATDGRPIFFFPREPFFPAGSFSPESTSWRAPLAGEMSMSEFFAAGGWGMAGPRAPAPNRGARAESQCPGPLVAMVGAAPGARRSPGGAHRRPVHDVHGLDQRGGGSPGAVPRGEWRRTPRITEVSEGARLRAPSPHRPVTGQRLDLCPAALRKRSRNLMSLPAGGLPLSALPPS